MALARCENCGQPAGRGGRVYALAVLPVGYPDTSAICGTRGCENPALIWLHQDDDESETQAYKLGQRIFKIPSFAIKIKVSDTVKYKKDHA